MNWPEVWWDGDRYHVARFGPGDELLCSSGVYDHMVPAAYWWTGSNGTRSALCIRCCAWWRIHARDDPELAPQLIVPVEQPPLTF